MLEKIKSLFNKKVKVPEEESLVDVAEVEDNEKLLSSMTIEELMADKDLTDLAEKILAETGVSMSSTAKISASSSSKVAGSRTEVVYTPETKNFLLRNLLEINGLEYSKTLKESKKVGKPILEYLILTNIVTASEVVSFFSEETGIEILKSLDGMKLISQTSFYKEYEGEKLVVYYPFEELLERFQEEFPTHQVLLTTYDKFLIKEINSTEGLKADFLLLVQEAMRLNVSDIHMEVKDYALEVKFRILGDIQTVDTISLEKALNLQKFIKDLASKYTKAANFDTETWEARQDARIEIEELKIDLRLAFTPSLVQGHQNYVMRILKTEGSIKTSQASDVMVYMGYFADDVAEFIKWVEKPKGIILVSGATGSGKSKMLNTLIASVNEDRKIVTAEDPVEYKIPNAAQHQVFRKEMQDKVIDMSFLEYIRAFMRQDPDIIFIGEWRKERELTEAIVYASNTGHLVLTSLHSSSSALIPGLLINDYGLDKTDVANNSIGFINQKLIKRVCQSCSSVRTVTAEEIEKLKRVVEATEDKMIIEKAISGKEIRFSGTGCQKCTVTSASGKVISVGYSGRMATYEWIKVDEEMQETINATVNVNDINKVIRRKVGEGKAKRYIDTTLRKLLLKEIDFNEFMVFMKGL